MRNNIKIHIHNTIRIEIYSNNNIKMGIYNSPKIKAFNDTKIETYSVPRTEIYNGPKMEALSRNPAIKHPPNRIIKSIITTKIYFKSGIILSNNPRFSTLPSIRGRL